MWVLKLILVVGGLQTEGMMHFDTQADCSRALILQKQAAVMLAQRGLKYRVRGECVFEQVA